MQTNKFDQIIESYINGNISWVREQVKKMSKAKRKELYIYYMNSYPSQPNEQLFFLSLI
jgi:hypothetical protein